MISPEHFRFWELRWRIRESLYPTILDEGQLFDLQVAVGEACADALKRARKKVGVVAWELEDRVVVEITGTAGIPLVDPWGSEAHSARFGVSLMALLADQVQVSRLTGDVTRVSLTFLLGRGARPGSERERAVLHQGLPGKTERLEDPRVHGLALTGAELKEQQQLAWGLARQAFHDPLTGLANRALLFDRLENALARARRRGTSVGIMMLDMDGFKEVNDSLGHAAGDRLLCMVAARLTSLLRSADTAARLGGDEFVVVLSDDIGGGEISSTADRILRHLQEPYDLSTGLVSVGFSMGVALSDASAITAVELVNQADAAMYMVKADGKSSWTFFHPQMLGLSLERRCRSQKAANDAAVAPVGKGVRFALPQERAEEVGPKNSFEGREDR